MGAACQRAALFSGNFSSNEAAEESNEGCRIAAFSSSVVTQASGVLCDIVFISIQTITCSSLCAYLIIPTSPLTHGTVSEGDQWENMKTEPSGESVLSFSKPMIVHHS